MAVPNTAEKWSTPTQMVTIGATKDEGGTRGSKVTVGGGGALPFLHFEGEFPNKPVVAMDVWDIKPDDWPAEFTEIFGDALGNPGEWAKKCKEFGADMICLRLRGTHPDYGDRSPEDAAASVKAVLEACDLPVMVLGCDIADKDNDVFPKVCQAGAGENMLVGYAVEKNYRTLTASCLADKHKIACNSPLDINIAKQINILVTEMGYPVGNIVISPSTGGLGYGMEYSYSVMERGRNASLSGDKLLAQPVMCDVGFEAWRAKEAKSDEMPEWGSQKDRGYMWEAITATSLLQAGGDLFIMRHPKAVEVVKKTIDALMKK